MQNGRPSGLPTSPSSAWNIPFPTSGHGHASPILPPSPARPPLRPPHTQWAWNADSSGWPFLSQIPALGPGAPVESVYRSCPVAPKGVRPCSASFLILPTKQIIRRDLPHTAFQTLLADSEMSRSPHQATSQPGLHPPSLLLFLLVP